jgi:hypothetical protein
MALTSGASREDVARRPSLKCGVAAVLAFAVVASGLAAAQQANVNLDYNPQKCGR